MRVIRIYHAFVTNAAIALYPVAMYNIGNSITMISEANYLDCCLSFELGDPSSL
jgi:hypothetical protein